MASPRQQQSFDFVHPSAHFDRLHTNAHGTVLIWDKQALEKRWTKLRPGAADVPDLLAAHLGQNDRYMTVNEFHSWRVVKQLKSLRACYVDIDGNTDLESVIDMLTAAKMPAPSFVVRSGRGLHLYWEIEPVGAEALGVWQRVQNALVAAVAGDPLARDCARVLRLVGSVNSKSKTEVLGLIWSGVRWTLHELSDEVLGRRKPRAEVRDISVARARKNPRTAGAGSIYERWRLVYADILAIGEYHRKLSGSIPEGRRDAYLFLYGVALSWFASPDTLVDEISSAARTWTPDLTLAEVKLALQTTLQRATLAAEGKKVEWHRLNGTVELVDPRYRFKRQSLYDWLEAIIPADLLTTLHAIIPDSLAETRKAARNSARSADHYTGQGVRGSNLAKRSQAILMHSEGNLSVREIAGKLGTSHVTVVKWLRAAATEGVVTK